MKNYRTWGKPPYKVAVIHGGPGCPGSIAAVARELSGDMGVLEPLQTADSVGGQVSELHAVLEKHAETPVTLVGWSWGATLSYLTAAEHPELVKKLILIGTGPIDSKGKPRPDLTPIYMERLSEAARKRFFELVNQFQDGKPGDKGPVFGKLCGVINKAEVYAPIPAEDDVLEYQMDINMAIGLELRDMIPNGTLAQSCKKIKCPVTAIQGDYDPRPAADIDNAFSGAVKDYHLVLLEKCGHTPWLEKYARDEFFRVLKREIR
ncbi:MAG: alpha/beta hydrolase [Dehalococcoidales bacterium]|jgi:pimeloyl-ACP methyl ester carboxylesterase